MRVSVFGLGYLGWVTAGLLGRAGHEIVGVDVNREKVEMINAAASPVVEPGLAELLAEVVGARRLRATTSTQEAVASSSLSLICVGTPGRVNGQLDLRAIERVGVAIGEALAARGEAHTVVLRSTVLPGVTEGVLVPAILSGVGPAYLARLHVALNPEFMREGSSLRDFSTPPLTLVWCDDPETVGFLRSLYAKVDAPF